MLGIEGECLGGHPKGKFLIVVLEISEQSAVKHYFLKKSLIENFIFFCSVFYLIS